MPLMDAGVISSTDAFIGGSTIDDSEDAQISEVLGDLGLHMC